MTDDVTTPPSHDRVLDERGKVCPLPVIALARMTNALPDARLLLLSDDPAAESDVPAWCGLRGRVLAWVGDAPDGRGRGYLVVPSGGDSAGGSAGGSDSPASSSTR